MVGLALTAALALATDAPVRHARLLLDDATSRDQLNAEITRLDAERPSFGAPIALLSIGAGSLLLGGYLGTTGVVALATRSATLTPEQRTAASIALIAGISVFAIGATLAILGTVLLLKRLSALKAHSQQLEDARKKLDRLNEEAPPAPPVPVTLLVF